MELLGVSLARSGAINGVDFRTFYAAGHLISTAPTQLYDVVAQKHVQDTLVSPSDVAIPFYHPSCEALFFLPLARLSYRTAYLTFIAVNVFLLGLAVYFGPRHPPFPLALWSRSVAFFLFLPVLFTILEGQDSILLLLICCIALRELRHGRDLLSGCILGLGIFRPHLMLPLALLLACRQGWRFLGGFTAVSSALTLFSGILVGRDGIKALSLLLGKATLVTGTAASAQRYIAVYPQRMPNLYGLIYAVGGRFMTPGALFEVTALFSILIFLACAYILRRSPTTAGAFAVATLGTALISYHLYAYDATILLFAILLLSGRLHSYLVIAGYILPYILFLTISDWFSLFATVPVALLINAAFRNLRHPPAHKHPRLPAPHTQPDQQPDQQPTTV